MSEHSQRLCRIVLRFQSFSQPSNARSAVELPIVAAKPQPNGAEPEYLVPAATTQVGQVGRYYLPTDLGT